MNQKKTCKHEYCDRETFNKNDDYCIFHSKDIEGKKNQFNEAFDKEFKLQHQKEEDFYFIYFIFPNDFDYFKKNTIKKNICFCYTTFKGEADFREAKFKGDASFAGVTFERKANFAGVTFEGDADFRGAIFKGEDYFGVVNINYNKLDLGDTFFYDSHDLLNQVEKEIKNNKLDNIYYVNKFKKINNNKILSKLKNWFINRFKITKFATNEIFPILGERSTKRYPIIARTINDDDYLMKFKKKHPKLFFFWWISADCGRSIFRWAFWSMIFAVFFGLIYSNITVPGWLPDLIQNFLLNINPKLTFTSPPNVFTPFYYSIVTFTTLGFGDVTPTNFWGEFWVTLEVILGYVMLGGLISIFANKIARRS